MLTEVYCPVLVPATDKKGIKGKQKIKEKKDKDRKGIGVSARDSSGRLRKIAARRAEGKGIKEVDSDNLSAKDNKSNAINKSELSSYVNLDSDTNANKEKRSARKKEKNAAKGA